MDSNDKYQLLLESVVNRLLLKAREIKSRSNKSEADTATLFGYMCTLSLMEQQVDVFDIDRSTVSMVGFDAEKEFLYGK